MKDNETLKKTLLHYINLEYYANEIDVEFQTLLEELEERCTKAILSQKALNTKLSYNTVIKVIKEEVEKFRQLLEERLEEEAENIMNLEQEFLDETYNKKGGINGILLALGGITASKVLFAPIAGSETVKQFVDKTEKNIYRSYDTSLRSGYLFGQSTEDINNQIGNKLKQVSRGMQSGIRTAIPSFAKTTDRIIFLNNNVEVVWVATLDGRTCINCAGLSGIHFKSITEAPSVPQHFSCRCTLCPVATISEPIPDFKEFIESLNEEEQKHVLGVERFKLWKQYDVSLDKFLNNGTVMTNEELKDSLGIANNKNLIIPDSKLIEYALNPQKSKGKAEVFKSALGYSLDNYKDLKENIITNLKQKDMLFIDEDEFGKRYRCDFKITGPNGKSAEIRTGWIKKADSDELQLRLTTVYMR